MRVSLVVIEGVHQGKVIPLNTERFEIGRGEGCQLRPKSQTVSVRQCAITRRGRYVIVEDLGSTNGTLVNERCLRMGDETRVGDGDRLQVGQLIFTFRIETGPGENDSDPDDWLTSTPNPIPGADIDMKSGTMMMASPVRVDPTVADRAGERLTAQAQAPDPNTVRFTYRVFDEKHKVVILGLSQDQVDDDEGARSLRRTLFGLVTKKKVRRMVLDLGAVDDLNSMALATFLAVARQCEQGDGALRFCGAAPSVKRMFKALRFEAVMASYDDKDKAVVDPWR